MHYGKNKYTVLFNAIENTERKSGGQAATDVGVQNRPCFGKRKNVLDCSMNLENEIFPEPGRTPLIIGRSLLKFDLGFGVEEKIHFASRSCISSKTRDPPTGLTRPDLSSESRRFAT